MEEIVAVIAMAAGAGTVALILMMLSHWLGPKRPNPVKAEIFECGNIPVSDASRIRVQYYPAAILFVLFDIELIFLLPWSVVFQTLGIPALISMGLFMLVLVVGLVYALKRGMLQWD